MNDLRKWLIVPALASVAWMMTGSSSRASSSSKLMPLDAAAIRKLALPVENRLQQTGLANYLAARAFTESRYNADAQNDSGRKGLWQMSASTSNVDALGKPASVLLNPRWSLALVAWFIERLRAYGDPGQTIDWLAVTRGMAYPHLVNDVHESKPATQGATPGERSREVRERFEEALDYVGLPRSFMHRPAFPPGYHWPGINAVIAAAGIGGVS